MVKNELLKEEVKEINVIGVFTTEELVSKKEEYRLWDVESLELKIKSLSSSICRKKKIEKFKKEMEEMLIERRLIREIVSEKKERKVAIYERSIEDIKVMNYEEVMKGIRNISSIVCLEGQKDEKYQDKSKLEKCDIVLGWLKERKEEVSGTELGKVFVSDILRKIEDIESLEELKEWLLEKSK